MNIAFMGTPDFAVPSLELLIKEFGVKAVFTQPDRPKGRGKKLAMSPVKEVAMQNNIPVYQPLKIRNDEESMTVLKNLDLDFIIVVAFGQILPKKILDIPKYGCINLHGSLLPKYRGAAPIQWSVINGETLAGNTTMLMDVGLDTGDMLLTNKVEVTPDMTSGELYEILKVTGADLLSNTINELAQGNIKPKKQDDSKSSYASMLNKDIAKINWNLSAQKIHNLIRGLNPWPIATTSYGDLTMKIYKSHVENVNSEKVPGTIISVDKNGIKVATEEGVLVIEKLQFPNGKPLFVEQFINGNKIDIGTILK